MPARIFIVASTAKKKNSCSAFLVLNSFTALKAAIIPLAGMCIHLLDLEKAGCGVQGKTTELGNQTSPLSKGSKMKAAVMHVFLLFAH